MNLTMKEEKAINDFKKLSKAWPKSLWLFSGPGTLWVMKYKKNGKKAILNDGTMDSEYAIESINIENDGGDW